MEAGEVTRGDFCQKIALLGWVERSDTHAVGHYMVPKPMGFVGTQPILRDWSLIR